MWIAILALSGAALVDTLLIYCCMIVSGREEDAVRSMRCAKGREGEREAQ